MSTPQTYKGNGQHSYERVTPGVSRLRVPGGWLYRDNATATTVMAFVPMPAVVKHEV